MAVLYKPHSEALISISKPALVFSLLAFFLHRTKHLDTAKKYWVVAALFFSLGGDILLMQKSEGFFLAGVGLFGLAQIAYSGFYVSLKTPLRWRVIVPAALLPLAADISSGAKYIRLGVVYYGLCRFTGCTFLWSVNLASQVSGEVRYALLGIILFMASGFMLALAKFNDGDKYFQIGVMLTYGLAQYLITYGLLRYLETRINSKSAS
ncbi:MAG: lysoplasmalogenase [Owenweeksia sp.]|nr:lysoplasmalogenase [Owenweeksia sp.]